MSDMWIVVSLFWLQATLINGSTVYMITFPSQLDNTGEYYYYHIIGEPGTTVTIESPFIAQGGSAVSLGATGYYKGSVSRSLYYIEVKIYDVQTKGVRFSSDDYFTVSIIYGENLLSESAGGYSAIPVPVVPEPCFIIVTYDQNASSFVYFAIASSEDNIVVNIQVKTDDKVRFKGKEYFDGDNMELTMHKLQVLQLESQRDLTGTVIKSNGPIAVYVGIVCAAIPLGQSTCDNILEQLPSVDRWGSRYLAAPLLGRTGGDIFRAVAAYNDTNIERVRDRSVSNLQSGDVLEWEMVSDGDEIRGNKPILVVQFSKSSSVDSSGGSAMMVLWTVEYYSPKYYILAADGFDTYVNILIKTEDDSTLVFDDNDILTLTSVDHLEGVGSLFRFAVTEGVHVVQSTNFSAMFDAVVYGYSEGRGISYHALRSIPEQSTAGTTTPLPSTLTTGISAVTVTQSPTLSTSSSSSSSLSLSNASTLFSAASSSSLSESSSKSTTGSGTYLSSHIASTVISSFVGLNTDNNLVTSVQALTTVMTSASSHTSSSTSSLSSSSFVSALDGNFVSSDTSQIITPAMTSPFSSTSSLSSSSFVSVHDGTLVSSDTSQISIPAMTSPSSSTSSSSTVPSPDVSLVSLDTVHFITTATALPPTSSSSSSSSSVSAADDSPIFSVTVQVTSTMTDSSSVSVSPSTSSKSTSNTDSVAEFATYMGSTVISSTSEFPTDGNLVSKGTIQIITSAPGATPSMTPSSNLFLFESYITTIGAINGLTSTSTSTGDLLPSVTSVSATYELGLTVSPDVTLLAPSPVPSVTGPRMKQGQVIPTTRGIEMPTHSQKRMCHCRRKTQSSLNMTSIEFQQMILAKKKNLTLSREQLSSYIRSKTSAQDHRPVAQNVGYIGIAMLSTVAVLLFCGDVVTLMKRLF